MTTSWLSRMKADPTSWLLGHEDPAVRYRALTWIDDRPRSDPEVRAAREEARRHPRLETLFAGQHADGSWEEPDAFVDDYYYGAAWRLILAAQLLAGRTREVERGIEYLFSVAQCRAGGGMSHVGSPDRGGSLGGQWACLTGAVVEMLYHFGYGNDPRTQRALGFLTSRQQGDGLYPCANFKPNQRTLPLNCYMGSIKPLLAVLAFPPDQRTPELRSLCDRTARTLLTYGLYVYKRASDGQAAGKKDWLSFGFPRFWNTDLLEVAWILARLGYTSHPALDEAFRIILAKQLGNGRWRLEFHYNDRMPIPLGKPGTSNPWITLRALHTLRLASAGSGSLQTA